VHVFHGGFETVKHAYTEPDPTLQNHVYCAHLQTMKEGTVRVMCKWQVGDNV